jgi:hypothetical protein
MDWFLVGRKVGKLLPMQYNEVYGIPLRTVKNVNFKLSESVKHHNKSFVSPSLIKPK